jgi:hypothetical protein
MYAIEVERLTFNAALLERDLRAMCGEVYVGISTRPGVVTAYLTNDASADLLEPVRKLIEQHDASQLTEEQVKAAVNRAALEAARQTRGDFLNPDAFSQNALLQQLAAKLAWLEREISDLRGL